jgi:parallel beta-helix repeat protein
MDPIPMETICEESADSTYIMHDPIIIDSNDDFDTQGWPGDGTFQFPYIIEGLEITGIICIDISFTTVNFEIRDCFLIPRGSYSCGVKLDELQNATIKSCKIDVLFCTGISVNYAFNCSILGNDIYSESSGGFGIYLDDLHTGELSDNSVTLDEGGIQLIGCTDVSILRNSVIGKQSSIGFADSLSSVIINNTIVQGGFRFDEDYFLCVNIFTGNVVNGLPVGYFINVKNLEIDGMLYGQVILANSSDTSVIGGIFNNCEIGVQVAWCTNCIVDGVSASWNYIGIQLTNLLNCTISNSTTIQSIHAGVQLVGSDNCTITGCETAFSNEGVEIFYSSYCNITRCKIYSNLHGISIQHGINANIIWDNRLGWNDINAEDDAPTTLWDDGMSRGNSWSDYSGIGTYEISGEGGTEDRYPSRLVDNLKPTINHPEDIYYEEGVKEYFITWIPSDEYPSWYKILRHHADEGPWKGNQITSNVSDYVLGDYDVSVAGLPPGVFNITIIVSDGAGNQAVDSVLIYSVLYSPNDTNTTTTPNFQEAIGVVVALLAISLGGVGVLILVMYTMNRRKLD